MSLWSCRKKKHETPERVRSLIKNNVSPKNPTDRVIQGTTNTDNIEERLYGFDLGRKAAKTRVRFGREGLKSKRRNWLFLCPHICQYIL